MIDMRRALLLLAVAAVLSGCTSAASNPAPGSSRPATSGAPTPSPSPTVTAAIATGPTAAARAADCPFAGTGAVMKIMGMRLSHVTVLRSGGRTVGCRFYAIDTGPLAKTENLPPPDQPAVEITTQRFASATIAHNASVRTAERGTNVQQIAFGAATGLCFQTAFYGRDHGADYACTINSGSTQLLVRTVDTTGTLDTSAVTTAALGVL